MAKGQNFERKLCKAFSLWWSKGYGIDPPQDNIFWRTAGSGARARVRTNKNKDVHTGFGDMLAENSIGQPLLNHCVLEFKKGYKNCCFVDLIASKKKIPPLIKFLQEAEKDARDAGNRPILVLEKDRYDSIIGLSFPLFAFLNYHNGKLEKSTPVIKIKHQLIDYEYYFIKLDSFFNWVDPVTFEEDYKPVTFEGKYK